MPESQAFALQSTTEILKNKFDCALLRHDAWWLVFIAVLIGLRREADRRGLRLHLAGRRNHAVSRPVQVVGLEKVIDLKDDARTVVAELVPAR